MTKKSNVVPEYIENFKILNFPVKKLGVRLKKLRVSLVTVNTHFLGGGVFDHILYLMKIIF